MRPARLAVIIASILASSAGFSARAEAAVTCASFMEAFARAAPAIKPQFVRPVVVTRGSGEASGEARDLVSEFNVDARLFCNEDRFVRFEAQAPAMADQKLRDGYSVIQEASLMAAFRWPRARAAQTAQAMAAEASEYLRGSIQRGDVYIAGKTERRAGRDGEIAMMWTERERTFIVLAGSQ
jgi:hypothetical protein